jgi:hypothetical protein
VVRMAGVGRRPVAIARVTVRPTLVPPSNAAVPGAPSPESSAGPALTTSTTSTPPACASPLTSDFAWRSPTSPSTRRRHTREAWIEADPHATVLPSARHNDWTWSGSGWARGGARPGPQGSSPARSAARR